MSADVSTQRTLVLAHENGLHLTPISAVVKAATPFSAEIAIAFGEKSANAKSTMELMTLGATSGSQLVISATGEDSQAAVDAIVDALGQF